MTYTHHTHTPHTQVMSLNISCDPSPSLPHFVRLPHPLTRTNTLPFTCSTPPLTTSLPHTSLHASHLLSFLPSPPLSAWDIARCLYPQCVLSQVPFPHYANKWLDVRKLFAAFYRTPKTNIEGMLDHLGKGFVGRQHCGRDDAMNIVTILQQLLKDGCILKYNQFLQLDRLKSK